ncbi:MAG: helix-turn-helix transcriptional regulator [Spirochaetales bacterium]|nr:helix-turn-helix transcriptional regulator [Spirochaetales bacterium]
MAESIKTILGRNIKNLRLQRGLSQSQLAEMVDVSFRYISYVECGKSFPSSEVLESLSQALNVPVYLLFCNNEAHDEHIDTELKSAIVDSLNEFQSSIEKLRNRINTL